MSETVICLYHSVGILVQTLHPPTPSLPSACIGLKMAIALPPSAKCKAGDDDALSVSGDSVATTAYPPSAASSMPSGTSSAADQPDNVEQMFETFVRDNDPELLAIVNSPAPSVMSGDHDDTSSSKPIELTEGIKRAIANYELATGKVLSAEEIMNVEEGVVYWSCQGMKLAAHQPGGHHQKNIRQLEWDQVAKDMYNGLPDNDKLAFKKKKLEHFQLVPVL